MANYRNLRRQAEDAQKKYARYNEIMTNYAGQIDAYNAAGTEHNAFIEQVRVGANKGVGKTANGGWALVGSHDGQLAYDVRDEEGRPMDAGAMYGSFGEGVAAIEVDSRAPGGSQFWAKNADGTATRYQYFANPDYGYPVNTQPPHDDYGYPVQTPQPHDDYGYPVQTPQQVSPGSWHPATIGYRSMEFDKPEPVAPDAEPPKLNLTNSQIKEMNNPTADAAGAITSAAKDYGVKTSEANAAPSANSALAGLDPEDQFKDKGILARVLGGNL